MTPAWFFSSAQRRVVEPILAVFTVLLTVVWVTEPEPVFGGGIDAGIAGSAFVPATLLVPGLLAVSVLARVARHGLRLALASVGSGDRTRDGDWRLRRIGTSLVFGALAGYTLWWVVASVYVLTADVGGVMLGPLAALVVGSVLSLLVLGRTVLGRLQVGRERGH